MSKKQETYRVTFGDTTEVLTEEELQNFVKTAVVHNKDISRFSVERVDAPSSENTDEVGNGKIKELLNDSGARAVRIAALTNELGPTVDAMHIVSNLADVIKLLGYGEDSEN